MHRLTLGRSSIKIAQLLWLPRGPHRWWESQRSAAEGGALWPRWPWRFVSVCRQRPGCAGRRRPGCHRDMGHLRPVSSL